MDEVVREGFLCPICMQDLKSVHKLQNHFETSHSAEDKAVFDQIKGSLRLSIISYLGFLTCLSNLLNHCFVKSTWWS